MNIKGVVKLQFPEIKDNRGNISFVENGIHIPYDIKRVFYLYDIPTNSKRGGHAHLNTQQTIIAVSGSFDVHLDNGLEKATIHLNHACEGLLLPIMIWREIDNFSSGSTCLVLASEFFDEKEYIRDYSKFKALISSHEID